VFGKVVVKRPEPVEIDLKERDILAGGTAIFKFLVGNATDSQAPRQLG